MAKGFITLENGKDFFTRRTGYDMIIEIVIKELKARKPGCELADWLTTRVPAEGEHRGDAVFHNAKGEMILRTLDLRGLTEANRRLFWGAVALGNKNLKASGSSYSNLNPDRLQELYETHLQTPETFEIDTVTEETIIVKGEAIEKVGPGW